MAMDKNKNNSMNSIKIVQEILHVYRKLPIQVFSLIHLATNCVYPLIKRILFKGKEITSKVNHLHHTVSNTSQL